MQKHFQYNNSNIFYNVYGEGQPVVLLHGFAEDSSIWNNQTRFLQQSCKLIVPDLPGSGKSGILQKDLITIEDYATCLNNLLEAEDVTGCIVLGHSMGGYIALAFAKLFPQKLAGFGLVNSTGFADSEDKKNTRRKAISFIRENGVYPFIKNSTPALFSNQFKNENKQKVDDLTERGKSFTKEALIQYYEAMISRPDRTAVLKESKVPVLFIIGTEDITAPVDDLLKQVHLPSISFINIIKGVGHMSMLEKPDELNSHLLTFIQETYSL